MVIICIILKVVDQLGCSSLHFLYILLIKDILWSPDNITILFQHGPNIRFIEVNNCVFVEMLEGFLNNC